MLIDALIVKKGKPIVFKCDTSCPNFCNHCCSVGKEAFRGINPEQGAICPLIARKGGVSLAEDNNKRF